MKVDRGKEVERMKIFFIAFLLVLACFCVSITSCKQKAEEAAPPAEEAQPAEEVKPAEEAAPPAE